VDVERVDERDGHAVERLLEREALREGARDLVERVEAPRDGLLCGARLALALDRRLEVLVEPRVLDGDGELGGERHEEPRLALARYPAGRLIGVEEDGHLA